MSYSVEFLRDVKETAERGDLPWVIRHGWVYAALEPASQKRKVRPHACDTV